MTWLGFWQLDRAEQKQRRIEQISARQQQGHSRLAEIRLSGADLRDVPIEATGRFEDGKILLWDNRIYEGQVGYEVLGILTTSYGKLLVNLGWTPAPEYRAQLPQVALPKGMVTLQGVVVQPEVNLMVREHSEEGNRWPRRIQQVDMQWLESHLGLGLLPFVMQVTDSQSYGYYNNWKPVVMPPEKHYGYAIQWFGLAAACLTIFLVALYKKNKGRVDETDL